MRLPLDVPSNLDLIDRVGQRDGRWREAFALGKFVLEVRGRCLSCGRRIWSASGRRYCGETCRSRQGRRRERLRQALREAKEACPYCGCDPG